MGRPAGSPNKDKPYRDALRMVAAALDNGSDDAVKNPYPRGSLRGIAWSQLMRAEEETAAAKEIADRLDGKVAQGLIGGDEDDNPLRLIVTGVKRVGD